MCLVQRELPEDLGVPCPGGKPVAGFVGACQRCGERSSVVLGDQELDGGNQLYAEQSTPCSRFVLLLTCLSLLPYLKEGVSAKGKKDEAKIRKFFFKA